jgi:hypothetical protein
MFGGKWLWGTPSAELDESMRDDPAYLERKAVRT